jgi:hypothetical protein
MFVVEFDKPFIYMLKLPALGLGDMQVNMTCDVVGNSKDLIGFRRWGDRSFVEDCSQT